MAGSPYPSWRMHESNLSLEKANRKESERNRIAQIKNKPVPTVMPYSSDVCSFYKRKLALLCLVYWSAGPTVWFGLAQDLTRTNAYLTTFFG